MSQSLACPRPPLVSLAGCSRRGTCPTALIKISTKLFSSDALALVQNGGGLPVLQLFVVLADLCKALA